MAYHSSTRLTTTLNLCLKVYGMISPALSAVLLFMGTVRAGPRFQFAFSFFCEETLAQKNEN